MKMKRGKRDRPVVHERVIKLPKKCVTPDLHDLDEMRWLLNRIPAVQRDDEDFECAVCRSDDHTKFECPCPDKIPVEGVVLTPYYDFACLGCRKIGKDCCSQGTFAVRKYCPGCHSYGHWYWEKMCEDGCVYPPWIIRLPFTEYEEVPCTYERFKDGPNWLRILNKNKSDCNDSKETDAGDSSLDSDHQAEEL